MNYIKSKQNNGLLLKILIVWLFIFIFLGLHYSFKSASGPVRISVLPEVPRSGEAVVVTYKIANPDDKTSHTEYQLFVNGHLVESGMAAIPSGTRIEHQYSYANSLEKGEQVNFLLKTNSERGGMEKTISLPFYPPQIMSSFVSFAAFSVSVMSSVMTTEYFTNAFVDSATINTGLIINIVLIALFIFFELTASITLTNTSVILKRYRFYLANTATILSVIFCGMLITRIVIIVIQ